MPERSLGHLGAAAPAPVTSVDALRGVTTAMGPVNVPPARQPGWATLAALAVTTGVAAFALGGWAVLGTDASPRPVPSAREVALETSVSVLASPGATRIPMSRSARRLVLVVDGRGAAVLIVRGLGRAVDGRTYQAWITPPGTSELRPAGLFDGSDQVVPLSRPVAVGARVGVTVEDEGGAPTPSRVPRLTATRT